ncbi:thioesterase II family protein [Streptomyces sp. NPDC056580]|uniref:thioesterase II family protein n=1 Tax=Streptomyces sp. NPDC056580 TaxID=3345872 RepID=UPI0036BDB933
MIRPKQLDDAATTLVCLGFCGGGTGPYHPWAEVVAPDVDLALVCYPGRDGRFMEDFATTWDELAEDATRTVVSAVGDHPYVLFGHSMGGWMAFDVATRLEARNSSVPDALVVSSCNAPARGLTPRDMFPARQDTDEDLMTWMRTHGLVAEHVLGDPDLLEMAVEIMRADIAVRDTFHHNGALGRHHAGAVPRRRRRRGDRGRRARPVEGAGPRLLPARPVARRALLHPRGVADPAHPDQCDQPVERPRKAPGVPSP